MNQKVKHVNGLPLGWARAAVGDVAEYINGLAFKPSDWESHGRPIIRIQNLTGSDKYNHTTKEVSSKFVIRPGTILVSWSATLDVFVWQGPEAVLNQHIFKVLPKPLIEPVFVKWLLKNAIDEMWRSEHTHGTTMRHINRGPFLAHSLSLPPLREQARITDTLESYSSRLEAAVVSLEQAQAKLKAYRASLLKAAVEGRLVPTESELARAEQRDYESAEVLLERILTERRRRWEDEERARLTAAGKPPRDDKWKAKFQQPPVPNVETLPKLPEGWCWGTIGQLAEVSGGLTKNAARDNHRLRLPYLRVANVYANTLDLREIKTIGVTNAELSRVLLQSGDLLIVEGNGSIDQIGRVAVWDGSVPRIAHQNHLIKARFVELGVERWALAWLLSPGGRRLIQRVASSTSGLQTLSISKVESLPVPVPPVTEIERAVEQLEDLATVIEAQIQEIEKSNRRLSRLRQAILKWAFEGKLVDQDPNDEPADKLLERIRAERAAEVPVKKKARRRKTKTAE